MEINGLRADIHMPNAPKGEGQIHQLPPACEQHPLLVDEYPACPSNWMNGSDIASSYFMPLEPGKHMWLDFNHNAHYHKHDIAVVLSVQGINPITGQQTKQLRLEQYRTNCPVHDQPFKQDRFCEACGYKWPAQNYMSTTSTPNGLFWIDGFRAADGTVRGFLVTEEAVRGVANQMIGEDRVFAIGVAFYLSKNAKPVQPYHISPAHYGALGPSLIGSPKKSGPGSFGMTKKYMYEADTQWVYNGYAPDGMIASSNTLSAEPNCSAPTYSANNVSSKSAGGIGGSSAGAASWTANTKGATLARRSIVRTASLDAAPANESMGFAEDVKQIEPTKLEIAAGAVIQQELCYPDHNELSFWNDAPAGMIYINYCTRADFKKIVEAGKRQRSGSFLAGLTVGN